MPFSDDGLRSHLDNHLREADDAAQTVWSFPRRASQGGVLARWIGWIVLVWAALGVPINAIKQPQALGVIVGLLAVAAVIWLFVKLYRKPAWQRNARRYRGFVQHWGI
jgi:hypothetical protein